MLLLIPLLSVGCTSLKKQLKPRIEKIQKTHGIALYSFQRYFPKLSIDSQKPHSYCIENVEILFDNGLVLPLLDDYEWNQYIKKLTAENSSLSKKTNELVLSEKQLFLPPISNSLTRKNNLFPERRLGDTKWKFELGNINGYWVIESEAIFTIDGEDEKLFIAFNISGSFLYYHELNEFAVTNTKTGTPEQLCEKGDHLISDNIIVVDKIESTSPLIMEQIEAMNLIKSSIGRIKIPLGN